MMARPLNIMIADDDFDDQFFLKEAIREMNMLCEVNSVYNGVQLLNNLTHATRNLTDKPDVIFLDLNMPMLDGFSVMKEIKSNPVTSDIPIYVFSTSAFEDYIEKAIGLGARAYHVKPSDFSEYSKIVSKIFSEVSTGWQNFRRAYVLFWKEKSCIRSVQYKRTQLPWGGPGLELFVFIYSGLHRENITSLLASDPAATRTADPVDNSPILLIIYPFDSSSGI